MADRVAQSAGARDVGRVGELFPFTKFLPPALDDRVVAGRVVERLADAAAGHRLTVVSAPAGAGKTTALAAWARTADTPVAWVRMSADDRSPASAAAALLAGTRRVIDGFGQRLEQVLSNAEAAASTQHLVTSLVNDLGDGPPSTLVLDDFHELTDPDSLAFFDALLDHLPAEVRVLVGTRTEPPLSLPRRRVRGDVAELGLEDLRLDPASIRLVLSSDTEVSDELVDMVAAASGGWAAAVRLATARIASEVRAAAPDRTGHAVSSVQPDVWRFLAEEVLDAQPDDIRTFLLETSILEELSAVVCAAVTGRDDSAAMLAELERRNLFVARFTGADGQAWRYHELFADFLRDHLGTEHPQDAVAGLHRRAAAVLPPARAVPHLLAAGDHEQVARLAVDVAFESMDATILEVVVPWVEALPAGVVDRHHRLALLLSWRDEVRGRGADILARLEPMHARLLAEGAHAAAAELALELATAHLMHGELDRAGELLDEAVATPIEGWWHVATLVMRMHWCRDRGDWPGASASAGDAFDAAVALDGPAANKVLAGAVSSTLLFTDQGPAWALDRGQRLATRLAPTDVASRASLGTLFAGAALLALDLPGATAEVDRCLSTSRELGGLAWTHQEAEILLLALSLAAGDHATVRTVVDEARTRMPESPIDTAMRHLYAYAALRSDWLRGERRQLAATAARLLPPGEHTGRPEEQVVRALAGALAARADGRATDALEPLRDAEALQREARCWIGAGLPGLERAAILFEQGRTAAALEAAEPTLAVAAELGAGILLAEAEGYHALLQRCAQAGVHAEVVRAVLSVLDRPGSTPAVPVPGTGETLSPREVEVLAQVAAGRSNREIADVLFISEVTVKSHLTRILRKLDATSRTHAVARARELHLL